jgi:hypothetical protein
MGGAENDRQAMAYQNQHAMDELGREAGRQVREGRIRSGGDVVNFYRGELPRTFGSARRGRVGDRIVPFGSW